MGSVTGRWILPPTMNSVTHHELCRAPLQVLLPAIVAVIILI
jgi:hypothetical protein